MKIILAFTILFSLALLTPNAHAQMRKQTKKSSSLINSSDTSLGTTPRGVPISSAGAETSGILGSAPGDPYNLAHPFFRGDSRWSDPNQLYMHGDFPWAMVSKNPGAFNFDASTGQWEVSSTATLGKSK